MAEPFSFGVASDGSRLSRLAQDFAAGIVKRRSAGDSLTALHVTPRPEKLKLVPDHLQPSKLEADMVEFAREQELDVKWVSEQREQEISTGDALCKLVQDTACDFTCVGSYGRKDPDDPDHIGSTGSEPLKLMNGGCFVVKHSSTMPTDEPMKWLVSTDDSDFAMKAIKDTKSLMKEGDTLSIFMPTAGTVGMRTSVASIDAFKARKAHKYGQICGEDNFTFMLKEAGVSVSDVVLKHAEDNEVDVLVIAHKGLTYSYTAAEGEETAKTELGSTATGTCAADTSLGTARGLVPISLH